MIAFLLLVTATFRPPHPAVGDPIAIDFQQAVVIDRSPAYEIVSQKGSHVVVRTFEPKPFALNGVTGGVRFRNLVVPVRSVLAPKDSMKPAPLKPPRREPLPRAPLLAIAIAALAAAAAWAAVYALHRRDVERARRATPVPPAELFRRRVTALIDRASPQPWATLADLTRAYLAARGFSADLTTSQLLASLGGHELVADILRRGDLEKFSPWGAPSGNFAALAKRALTLPDEFEPVAAEVAA